MTSGLYLKCSREDLAPNALIVGDPARVALIREHLDSSREVAHHREYLIVTGTYRGSHLSVVATGIGAPAMAIAVEELASMGVSRIVRVGTMMAVTAALGKLVLAQAACRHEGTSSTYAPMSVPAVADASLYAAFRSALADKRVLWTEGLVATFDGFYSQMAPPASRLSLHPELSLERLSLWQVQGLDMETSALYVLCRYLNVAAVSLCAATVNAWDQRSLPDRERRELERTLAHVALDCIHAHELTLGGPA